MGTRKVISMKTTPSIYWLYNLVALASPDWQMLMENSVQWLLSFYEFTAWTAFRPGMVQSLIRAMFYAPSAKTMEELRLSPSGKQKLGDQGMEEKGELFSRLLFTLAHDFISGADTTMFFVRDLLKALLSDAHHNALESIDNAILEAKMNFFDSTATQTDLKHEDPTSYYLSPESYILLRRAMAIQLASQQQTYDQLLFYCGSPDGCFNEEKVGAILVQVRYKQQPTSLPLVLGEAFTLHDKAPPSRRKRRVTRSTFKNIIVRHSDAKILFMIPDFGTSEIGVDVPYSNASSRGSGLATQRGTTRTSFAVRGNLGHGMQLIHSSVIWCACQKIPILRSSMIRICLKTCFAMIISCLRAKMLMKMVEMCPWESWKHRRVRKMLMFL